MGRGGADGEEVWRERTFGERRQRVSFAGDGVAKDLFCG